MMPYMLNDHAVNDRPYSYVFNDHQTPRDRLKRFHIWGVNDDVSPTLRKLSFKRGLHPTSLLRGTMVLGKHMREKEVKSRAVALAEIEQWF